MIVSTTPGQSGPGNNGNEGVLYTPPGWGHPRGVIVKALDCGIVVSEFELQSRYYVHFRTNTIGKGMNPIILPVMG